MSVLDDIVATDQHDWCPLFYLADIPENNVVIVDEFGNPKDSGIAYGDIAITWQGEWSAVTAYAVNDMVSLSGNSYICILANTNITPPNATYWTLIAQKGDTGATGDTGVTGDTGATGDTGPAGLNWLGAWSAATAYIIDDAVDQDGSSYICILGHTNQEPPNATYWDVLAQKGTDGIGTGDVVGPGSATDNAIARFDTTTGKLIQSSSGTLADNGEAALNKLTLSDPKDSTQSQELIICPGGNVVPWDTIGTVKVKTFKKVLISDLTDTTKSQFLRICPGKVVVPWNPKATINFIIDGGGSAITTGQKGHIAVDFDCTITSVTTLLDQSGSIVVDIWKDTYANFPPADADSITASAPPTIASATKAKDISLTGWTTSINKGDILAYNVDSITTATRALISLEAIRIS